jgi:hypothetical protein
MAILGIKSVPLMRSTNVAWKTVPDFYFLARERSARSARAHVNTRSYDAIINLGRLDVELGESISPVFNDLDTIRAVSTPAALRRTMGDFLPPQTPANWIKGPGFGGTGTEFEPGWGFREYEPLGPGEDTQAHIEGTEYRVITVGESVVQASRKGERTVGANGRNQFAYEWVGIQGIRKSGIIPLLKEAIKLVPGGERSVLGWDIILAADKPYVIECNTSPGVNDATAARIVAAVKALVNET